MRLLTVLCLLVSAAAGGQKLSFEFGAVDTNFNYFQIPNDDANRVHLRDADEDTAYRLTYRHELSNDTFLYFLYAPLTLNYSFRSASSFDFDGKQFDGGQETDVGYRFNSYRAGWFKRFEWGNSFQAWGGVVAKIRDAYIEVEQGNKKQKFSNVGLVPLLGFGFLYRPVKGLGIFSHTDALTASQGSAYDSVLKLNIYFAQKQWLGIGKRVLGGGTDNDELKNFAQFDYWILDYTYSF